MAERRMFSKKITQSDEFLAMPSSTQNLYWHLNTEGDDEGFVNSPKKVMNMIKSSDDDMKLLIAKKFLLAFESGVIVIKHWKIHNAIRQDRFKPTSYVEERSKLIIREDGAYSENKNGELISDNQVTTNCQPTGCIGEDRIGEERIGKGSRESFVPPSLDEVIKYSLERGKSEQLAKKFFEFFSVGNWVDSKGNKVKNWKQKFITWESYNQPNLKNQRVEAITDYSATNSKPLTEEEENEIRERLKNIGTT